MSNTIKGRGTATLETFGGLVANVAAVDLPDGVSPRCYDVDFKTGGVFTRDGLSSIYSNGPLSAANFNYAKTYIQTTGQIDTLALDSLGTIWKEDVSANPGTLVDVLGGIIPGSYAKSTTANDREFIVFSNLVSGTDRPRQYDGTDFLPISQVGPGAPPSFQSNIGASVGGSITNFQITLNVVHVTGVFSSPFTAGEMVKIAGTNTYLDGVTLVVNGSPAPDGTDFYANYTHTNDTQSSLNGTVTPQFSYPITTITQNSPRTGFADMLWSDGPGSTSAGTVITIYYANAGSTDTVLQAAINSGVGVYIYVSGAKFGNGTWLVSGAGNGVAPGSGGSARPYLTYQINSSGQAHTGGGGAATGSYQLTAATVVTGVPILGLNVGDKVAITNAGAAGADGTWTVTNILKGAVLNITQTQMSAGGVATYTFTVESGVAPVSPGSVGQLVTVTDTLSGNGIFNGVAMTIASVSGSTFTVAGFSNTAAIPAVAESGTADVSVSSFTFDPGIQDLGTLVNPIFNTSSGGTVTLVGTSQEVGAGTRQGVVFFITETGYETAPSPPVTFTTIQNGNYILASDIPIGPPNVIARGIAFTEAGANGVPGANFYVIPDPVVIPASVAGQQLTYTSTIIRDNTTTSAKFTFTDAVLLAGQEIDIQGNDLFNLIEIGSSGWCVPYASRMFYGLQLNKVQNFNNLTFDGGYLLNNSNISGANIVPLGWTADQNYIPAGTLSLNASTVTGDSLTITNNTGSVQPILGMITQTAFQDPYQVAIIQSNVMYSVRVAVRAPLGASITGSLVIDLTDFNIATGYGVTYGQFTVPMFNMTSSTAVYGGPLLTTKFPGAVYSELRLRVYAALLPVGQSIEIDRIEVYPTEAPLLAAQVYGSYVNNLESIDAAGSGGILDTSSENTQPCMGAVVMKNDLYLLKTSSMYVTSDNSLTEPSGWTLDQVSPTVGTVGINSYDSGEEWLITACRTGIYGFDGKPPQKLMQEIQPLWEAINWTYGNSIVLRADIGHRRLLCAVPLPTGPGTKSYQWLPDAIPNANPTSPNVIFMLNYDGIDSITELMAAAPVRVTMFGTVKASDMHRKWTVWQIQTPYMAQITRQDGVSTPMLVCNGIGSSKIYQFLDTQLSDDGVAIHSLYMTSGAVDDAKAKEIPLYGQHRKLYAQAQFTMSGAGKMQVRMLKNTLSDPTPYSVPLGIALSDPALDDYSVPLNLSANRLFTEFSTNAAGSYFTLNKEMLTGNADPWASTKPNIGGNWGLV